METVARLNRPTYEEMRSQSMVEMRESRRERVYVSLERKDALSEIRFVRIKSLST
jgi:hypothetical protein